jgi:CubicO group peptidase (beta-lactamase class C family)
MNFAGRKGFMSTPSQQPQTAAELGLMRGFPPPPEQVVTHENQLLGPYNRWSFQNELPLNRVVDVWRGNAPLAAFEYDPLDLSQVTYQNRAGTSFTFADMVDMSYTDGIVVLHSGKLIYEHYLNGMRPHSLHAWASCSKSMTGTLAALLMHAGLFDPQALVSTYLPELEDSGFGDATVRQVMDMTTGIRFAEQDVDPVSENWKYSVALGWRARPEGYSGPLNAYDFLPTMQKDGQHGQRFTYLTPNTDVLAWLMKRLLNQSLAEIMHERIWSKLGTERDAFWIVGPLAFETAGSGLLTTLRDMARFGQLLLQQGEFNGRQILPVAVVEDIQQGEDRFSSYPTPTPAGNEFYSAFGAFPALAQWVMEGG